MVYALVVAASLTTPVARAEAAADTKSAAQRLAHEAAEAYKVGQYAESVTKFTAAYQAYPAPPLLLNLSRAELKLGRCAEALRDAQLFKTAAPSIESASADSPDEWLATVRRTCIEAEVHSTPEGAAIWIDGQRQANPEATPWVGRLPVGTHQILLWRSGYQEQNASMEVSANAPAHLTLALKPSSGETAPAPVALMPAAQTSGAEPVKTVSPAATKTRNPTLRTVGYVGTAVGGVALLTALILGVTSHTDATAVGTRAGTRTTAQADATLSSVNARVAGADALFGIGGALAAAGISLMVVF